MVFPALLPVQFKSLAVPGAKTPDPAKAPAPPVKPGKPPTIIVIDDNFNDLSIDIDGNGSGDVSHGRVVVNLIKTILPKAKVHEYDIKEDFVSAIDKRIRNGEQLDAINLSITTWDAHNGKPTTIPKLAEVTGLPLTRQNLAKHRQEIREKLNALSNADPTTLTDTQVAYVKTWEFSKKFQSLARHKVPIYVGAGNDGVDQINLTSLVEGTITIGAKHWWGMKTGYTADNDLVARYDRGNFRRIPIMKEGKLAGYDYTGDGRVDITAADMKGEPAVDHDLIAMWGTSYAAPTALGKDLRAKAREGNGSLMGRIHRNVSELGDTLAEIPYWEPVKWRMILPESFFDD